MDVRLATYPLPRMYELYAEFAYNSHIMYRDLADQSRRVVILLATAQRAQHMWIQFVLSLDAAFGS